MKVERSPKIDVLANYVFNHNKTMKPFDDLISDARRRMLFLPLGMRAKINSRVKLSMAHYYMTFQRMRSRKRNSDGQLDPLWLELDQYWQRKACRAQGTIEREYTKDEVQMYEAMCDFRWNVFLM